MDEQEIERLLRRHRPAASAPGLRERVLPPAAARTWPWAVAAAALLVLTVGLHNRTDAMPGMLIQRDESIRARVAYVAEQLDHAGADPDLAPVIVFEEEREQAFGRRVGLQVEVR